MNEDLNQETTVVRDEAGQPIKTEQTVSSTKSVGRGVILARVVYYIAGIIIAFLLMRIVLLLLGANQGSPFVDFVYGISGVFAWPFYGIFSYQPSYGHFTFEISSVVAIIVYGLIAVGLAKLFTLANDRPTV